MLVYTSVPVDNHCKTHGVGNSTPGLAVYVIFIIPMWLENHILVIHLQKIYGTSVVRKSYPS
jgi:hypothetical protein